MFILMSIKFGIFSAIVSSNILSSPFLHSLFSFWIPTMCILVCLIVFHKPLGLCLHFFNPFFLFLGLNNFHSSIFKSTDSSACLNLLLNPSSEFSISVIVLFISGFDFLKISISLLSPFCSVIILFTFSTSFYSSLSIFKIVVLKFSPNISVIRSFSGILLIYFFFLEWAILSYLYVL